MKVDSYSSQNDIDRNWEARNHGDGQSESDDGFNQPKKDKGGSSKGTKPEPKPVGSDWNVSPNQDLVLARPLTDVLFDEGIEDYTALEKLSGKKSSSALPEHVKTFAEYREQAILEQEKAKTLPPPIPEAAKVTPKAEAQRIVVETLRNLPINKDVKNGIAHEILKTNKVITPDNITDLTRQSITALRSEALANLESAGLKIAPDGHLILNEHSQKQIQDEDTAHFLDLFNQLTKAAETFGMLPKFENRTYTKETVTSLLQQDLKKMGLSADSVLAGLDPLILAELGGTRASDRGPRGLEQIVQKIIAKTEKDSGFTINDRGEVVLLSLADKINFFTKRKKLEAAGNSDAYKKLFALRNLKDELKYIKPLVPKQQAQFTAGKVAASTAISAASFAALGLAVGAPEKQKIEKPTKENFTPSALRMPAQVEYAEAQPDSTMAELGLSITAPQMEDEGDRQDPRAIEIGDETLDEHAGEQAVTTQIPESEQAMPERAADTRFKSTKFREPTSLNRTNKINPFKYQDKRSVEEIDSLPELTSPTDTASTVNPDNTESRDKRFSGSRQKMLGDIRNSSALSRLELEDVPVLKTLTKSKAEEFDPNKAPVLQDPDQSINNYLKVPAVPKFKAEMTETKLDPVVIIPTDETKPNSAKRLAAAQEKVGKALGIIDTRQDNGYSRTTVTQLNTKSAEVSQENNNEDGDVEDEEVAVEPTRYTSTTAVPKVTQGPEASRWGLDVRLSKTLEKQLSSDKKINANKVNIDAGLDEASRKQATVTKGILSKRIAQKETRTAPELGVKGMAFRDGLMAKLQTLGAESNTISSVLDAAINKFKTMEPMKRENFVKKMLKTLDIETMRALIAKK